MNPIWSILIPALAGLVSGIIGSLVAPWVTWGIEKRKEKMKRRQELVQSCRKMLDTHSRERFLETQEYRHIRPFLSEEAVKCMEGELVMARQPGGPDRLRQALAESIDELEKHWGLI